METCIFCKIINKEIPATIIYEDDKVIAFKDIHPQSEVHLLLIPKKHINSLFEATQEDQEILGYVQLVSAKIAKQLGVESYRLKINAGAPLQDVFHIHYHLLSGDTVFNTVER